MPIDILVTLHGLKDTPVPAILVLGGVSLLILAFVKAGIKFVIDPSQRKPAIIFGIVLLGLGIGLYLIPEQQDPSQPLLTPTPTITITDAPVVPSVIPPLPQTPFPTSWILGNKTSVDPQALCSITINDFQEANMLNVKQLQFTITEQNGYCSWIVPLNGYNATSKTSVTFWIRGEKGGEKYEVGLKDSQTLPGHEPKVSKTASIDWIQVSIPLSSFKNQDLASLENFSLNFKDGSGTVYVSQLVFTP